MSVSSELLEVAVDYLSHRVDLDGLDKWLAKHASDLVRVRDDDPMARLSGLIQVVLAEIDDEVAGEDDLRSQVMAFLSEYLQMLRTRTGSVDEAVEFFGDEFTVSSTAWPLQTVERTAA